jgi:hypothetical protein
MNVIFFNVVFIMSNVDSFFIYVYCEKRIVVGGVLSAHMHMGKN